MPHRRHASFISAVLAAFSFIACSDQSPAAPEATPDGVEHLGRPAEGTLFLFTVYATTGGRGAVLDAYVLDASGNPATAGTAVFQYCSLQGAPAPSAACDAGSGHWVRWGSAGFITSGALEGHALMAYDLAPPSGTTIGFRFRYLGKGSGIANDLSNSADYTWP
jgi:hypothetical protein